MYEHFKVYVGCGLTRAPEAFKTNVEALKTELGKFCQVLNSVDSGARSSKRETCVLAIGEVRACDLMLGICDEPSTGFGIQAGVQVLERRKPLLAVAHTHTRVTDMIVGLQSPNVLFRRYRLLREQVPGMVREALEKISRGEPIGPPSESLEDLFSTRPASDGVAAV
jgi:hypothetical protein